jgi:hypothetical protein
MSFGGNKRAVTRFGCADAARCRYANAERTQASPFFPFPFPFPSSFFLLPSSFFLLLLYQTKKPGFVMKPGFAQNKP